MRLRQAFGLPVDADPGEAVRALSARLGLPSSLRATGVRPGVRDQVVAGALADHSLPTNPRPLTGPALAALFDEAMG